MKKVLHNVGVFKKEEEWGEGVGGVGGGDEEEEEEDEEEEVE